MFLCSYSHACHLYTYNMKNSWNGVFISTNWTSEGISNFLFTEDPFTNWLSNLCKLYCLYFVYIRKFSLVVQIFWSVFLWIFFQFSFKCFIESKIGWRFCKVYESSVDEGFTFLRASPFLYALESGYLWLLIHFKNIINPLAPCISESCIKIKT